MHSRRLRRLRVLPGLQPARTPADARGGKKGTIVSLPTVHLRPPPPQSKVKFGGSGSKCCEPATVHTTPPKLVCWQAQVCIFCLSSQDGALPNTETRPPWLVF